MSVTKRRIDCSLTTPMTPPRGPVMPTSVMYAVPPGSTRASAVGTCVWVPTTAVTRPSRCQPIATFSLVASAWKSTRTWSTLSRSSRSAASGLAAQEVRRPHDGVDPVEVGEDVVAVIGVVAERDDVDAGGEQLVG